jgi:hypothetical protein
MIEKGINYCFAVLLSLLGVMIVVLLPRTSSTSAQILSQRFPVFLEKYVNFSEGDFAKLDQGEVIAKMLDTKEKGEVVAFGIVRMKVPKEFFLEKFRDIVVFKKSPAVLEIGKFSNPPSLEDIQELTLEPDDLKTLKKCKPGDCDVKINARTMERFRKEVDWSASDYKERATALMHQILVDYVKFYLEEGNASLGEYHDKKYTLRVADEFYSLLRQSPYLSEYVPNFYEYLKEFPKTRLSGTEDFIYWSKEKFGLKPVLSLTHVTIYKQHRDSGTPDIYIASKQLYANHYFEASLGLTAFVDGVEDTKTRGSYLMYLNRSRADALRGWFSSLRRSIVEGRIRDGLEGNLKLIKKRLEEEYQKKLGIRLVGFDNAGD